MTSERAEPIVAEEWTYDVGGKTIDGRQVWHVEPPGPKGSGIGYHVTRFKDVKADDGMWERHVYAWRLCVGHDEGADHCNCDPKDNEPVEVLISPARARVGLVACSSPRRGTSGGGSAANTAAVPLMTGQATTTPVHTDATTRRGRGD